MTRMVYLAYPIDQAQASLAYLYDLIETTKHRLIEEGVSILFDPGDAFSVRQGSTVGSEIAAINALAANQATAVMAFLPSGVATVGVPMEIDRAVRDGKWVAICSDVNGWMLDYRVPNVARFGLSASDIEAAVTWLAMKDTPFGGDTDLEPLPFMMNGSGAPRLPSKAHTDDAGFDLYVSEDTEIPPGSFVDIPCGLATELPEWSFGWITGRSSALRKRGLLVHTGIIDAGYRGPLYAGAWNMTDEVITVKAWERVAQLIIMPNLSRDLVPVETDGLNPSTRGAKGFGSSGP